MDTRDLDLLRQAERILAELADDRNWYDETPKHGGPDVPAWRGKHYEPEMMARIAWTNIRGVIARYIGHETLHR